MADDSSTDSTAVTETESIEVTATEQPKADVPPEVKKALREANKEAETLRRKLKEFEDAQKTEAEKLAERATQAEAELQALRVESIRSRVALTKGVPADLLEFLTATSEDDLSAQADRLLARLPPAAPGRPAGDVDQGVRTTPLALNGDPLVNDLKNKLGIR
jgi:regulator of protease activity HflC (stomatin/prohibitin superfamily)